MRQSLFENGRKWTDFETLLFNALAEELPQEFLFSKRLAAAQTMLEALDRYVELEKIGEASRG